MNTDLSMKERARTGTRQSQSLTASVAGVLGNDSSSYVRVDLQKMSHFNLKFGLEDMNPKPLEHNQKLTTEILIYLSIYH